MRDTGLIEFKAEEYLSDPNGILVAFAQCLAEGEHGEAQGLLASGLKHMNKSRLSKRYGIPRRTIYNLMDARHSPSLELVAKVCRALTLEAALLAKEGADSARKNARIGSRERKAIPVGSHPRL